MKKSLIAMAALALFANAQAEDSYLEVYGILDVGVATVQHSLPPSGTFPSTINPLQSGGINSTDYKRTTALVNGGMQLSRWGIKGGEDLGGGRKAFFVLESGFNPQTGALSDAKSALLSNATLNGGTTNSSSYANSSVNGQLFGRQAYVGVSEPDWGTVMLGRNYNQIYDVATNYDPVMKSDIMSPLGLSGTLGGGGGVSENTRVDNSLKYKNQIGPVNIGALYKFGARGGTGPGSGYAVNVGYEQGGFGMQAVYEAFNNQGILSISGGQGTVTVYNNDAYLLAAKYKSGNGTLKGGWERYNLKKPTDTPVDGYAYFGTATGGTSDIALTGYGGATQTVDIYFVGGDYNVSPAFNLAAGFYDIHYQAYTGKPAGDIFWYTMVGDYKFSKRTDMYGGFVMIDYRGDKYSGMTYQSNSLGMVGIRHKF